MQLGRVPQRGARSGRWGYDIVTYHAGYWRSAAGLVPLILYYNRDAIVLGNNNKIKGQGMRGENEEWLQLFIEDVLQAKSHRGGRAGRNNAAIYVILALTIKIKLENNNNNLHLLVLGRRRWQSVVVVCNWVRN